jgi:hypothetical protein
VTSVWSFIDDIRIALTRNVAIDAHVLTIVLGLTIATITGHSSNLLGVNGLQARS